MCDNSTPQPQLRTGRLWQSDLACAVNYEGDVAEGVKHLGFAKAHLRRMLQTSPGATSAVFHPADGVEVTVYSRPNRIRIKAGGELTVMANAAIVDIQSLFNQDSWLFKKPTDTPKVKQDYHAMARYWYSDDKGRALAWTSLPVFNPVVEPTTQVIKKVYVHGKQYTYPGLIADTTHLLAACFIKPSDAAIIRNTRTGINGPLVWIALGAFVAVNANNYQKRITKIQACWLDNNNKILQQVSPELKVDIPALNDGNTFLDVSFSKQADCLLVCYHAGDSRIDRYDLTLVEDGTLTTAGSQIVALALTESVQEVLLYGEATAEDYWFAYSHIDISRTSTATQTSGSSNSTYAFDLRLGKVALATNTVTLNVKSLYTDTLTGTSICERFNPNTAGQEYSTGSIASENLYITFGFYDPATDIALFMVVRQTVNVAIDGTSSSVDTVTSQTATAHRYMDGSAQSLGPVMPNFTETVHQQWNGINYVNSQFSNQQPTPYRETKFLLNNNSISIDAVIGPGSGLAFTHGSDCLVITWLANYLFGWFRKGFSSPTGWTYSPISHFGALQTKVSKGENGKVMLYQFSIAVSPNQFPQSADYLFTDYGQFKIDKTITQVIPFSLAFDNVSVTK